MCIDPENKDPFSGHPILEQAPALLVNLKCAHCGYEFRAFIGNPLTRLSQATCPNCRRITTDTLPWTERIVAVVTDGEMIFADAQEQLAYAVERDAPSHNFEVEIVSLVCPQCGAFIRYVGLDPVHHIGCVRCTRCNTSTVMYKNWRSGGKTIAILSPDSIFYPHADSQDCFRLSSLRPATT